MTLRGGAGAIAQPVAMSAERTALLRSLRAITLGPAATVLQIVQLFLHAVGSGVELEGLLPGRDRFRVEPVLHVGVTEVLEYDGVFLGAVHLALELAQRIAVLSLLVVSPPKAVDEIPVVGFELDGLGDQRDGFVEVLTALRVHVPDVVVRFGVGGIERDDAPERSHRGVALSFALEGAADLEVELLVLVVEAQAFLERLEGPVVLLGAEEGRAQIEEELRLLRLEVDGLAKDGNRLVVALGAPVQKAELHPCVDGSRVGAQDTLELRARLGILAAVHVRGGEEIARAYVVRLEAQHAAERVDRAVPLLLLVVDGAELHPQPRVAGRGFREPFDLRAGFVRPSEANQHIAESFDECRILRIGARGPAVYVDCGLGIAARLVHVPEGGPRPVVVGIELDGRGQAAGRLVPGLGFDRQPTEKELRLRGARIALREPNKDGARAIELFLLDLVPGEGQIRVLGAGVQRDHALELRFGLRPLLLGAQQLREGEVRPHLIRRELDGAPGRLRGLVGRVRAREPMGELRPEECGLGIALDRLAERLERFAEAPALRVELRDRIEVVGVSARVGRDDHASRRVFERARGRASRRAAGDDRGGQDDEDDLHTAPREPGGVRGKRRAVTSRRRAASARSESAIAAAAASMSAWSAEVNTTARGGFGATLTASPSRAPSANRSACTSGNRSRTFVVSSPARSVSSCSHGEVSTTMRSVPPDKPSGRRGRAASRPTIDVHVRRIRNSRRRSVI